MTKEEEANQTSKQQDDTEKSTANGDVQTKCESPTNNDSSTTKIVDESKSDDKSDTEDNEKCTMTDSNSKPNIKP